MDTKTELLLRHALGICQEVTDRVDVEQSLLRSVFERLCLEADEMDMDQDVPPLAAPGGVH